MTDRTQPDSDRIITSGDLLLHDAETALMYEELRAAIDDGHESMTHADALAEISAMRAENAVRLEIEALRSRQCLHGISEPSGWMPIETAPKDGTAIDLWRVGGGREPCAVWGLPPHCCGEMGRLCDSDWHDYQQGWVTDWFDEPEPDSEFTHWMHLPPQPTTSAGSGKGE